MKSGGGAVLLCLNFLAILESETDIVGTVDGGIFDKAVPAVNVELFQGVRQLLEGFEEGFVFNQYCLQQLPVACTNRTAKSQNRTNRASDSGRTRSLPGQQPCRPV